MRGGGGGVMERGREKGRGSLGISYNFLKWGVGEKMGGVGKKIPSYLGWTGSFVSILFVKLSKLAWPDKNKLLQL